jgi:hypothetical protein
MDVQSKAGTDVGKYLDTDADSSAEWRRGPRPARKAGAKRRGVQRPDRRTVQAGVALGKTPVGQAFSQGLCLCQSSEITPSFIIIVLLGVIAILMLYILYLSVCKRAKPAAVVKPIAGPKAVAKAPPVAVASSSISSDVQVRRTKLPQMVYFCSSAVHRPRSFHVCETCPALKRVQSFCTAVACKNCVDQNFDD